MRRGLGLSRMSKKRASQRPDYDATVQRVFIRAKGQCEVVLDNARCPRRAKDAHHAVKRSQGGEDTPDNLLAVCRPCHDRTDTDYQRGRLVVTALGGERFTCTLRYASDKFTARKRSEA